jgi:hypothetical protein
MSIYWAPSTTATLPLVDDLKHRLARVRAKGKRRLLAIERHHHTGRYSLVYLPLGELVEGYQGTTLKRIEHALEMIPIKRHPKKRRCTPHSTSRCTPRRPMPVVVDQHLNAEGQYE